MRKFLLIALSLAGLVGVILSLIMFIAAISFCELGRIILYFITLFVCGEMSVICIIKLCKNKNDIT